MGILALTSNALVMALLYSQAGNVLKEIYEKRVGVRNALYKQSINDRLIRKVCFC